MQFGTAGRTFVFLLIFSGLVFSGTTGKIAGIVKDKESGEPLIGANVFLEGTSLGSTTDIDGSYFILNVPPGVYTLVVQYIGYHEVRISNVQVSIDLTTRMNIEMTSETIELGDEIVVTARRDIVQKDLTSSESRVSSEKIEQLPVNEINDVLQIQAGITRDAGGGFHIRGGRSSEIAYWVNGVSITDGFDNSRAIEIENQSVQELQVISGTFNAEYGNAMSGIINIVTKEGGDQFHANLEAYSGDYLSNDKETFFNIDDISPRDIYSFQGSIDGPIPFTGKKGRIYATVRHQYNEGYLYGARVFSPAGKLQVANIDTNKLKTAQTFADTLKTFGTVPMNWRRRTTGQAKLTFFATNTLKINLEGLFSTERFRDYNHSFKLNPDGDVKKFNDSYNLSLIVNHTLSNSTFYTLNLTYLNREFNEYLYKNPFDPRYQDPDSLPPVPPDNFNVGGTNFHRFNRITRNYVGKIDVTSQIHPAHLMKTGIEVRYSKLSQDDYNLIPPKGTTPPKIPDVSSPLRDIFDAQPIQFAAYLQDKIELENVIINIGVRLDYFDSRGKVLADPRDPDIYRPLLPAHQQMTFAERQKIWYKDATPKYQVSPRLGIAYPISANGVIHFSFGDFLQIPQLRHLFQNAQFKISEVSGQKSPFGNPDLDAQRTVQYELGLQQRISTDFKVDFTGYYRDIRDWVTTGPEIDTYLAGTRYAQFINKDYANVRGFTLSLTKRMSHSFAFDVVYQFQVAEGTNSNADEEFLQRNSGFEPTIQLTPLDWDQTHTINGSVYYGGKNWGISLIARYNTGLPYTPAINIDRATVVGLNATNANPKNSRRKPSDFVVDFRAQKIFMVNDVKIRVYARVFNLFDRRNEINVFSDTGRASSTNIAASTADPFFLVRPDFYDPPRQIQIGFALDL